MNQKYLFFNVKLHLSGSEAPFPKLLKHEELKLLQVSNPRQFKVLFQPSRISLPSQGGVLAFYLPSLSYTFKYMSERKAPIVTCIVLI